MHLLLSNADGGGGGWGEGLDGMGRTCGWSKRSLNITENLLENLIKWLKVHTTGRKFVVKSPAHAQPPPSFSQG